MKDRRKYERYQHNVPIAIEWDGEEFEGKLVNLSMTGAGCFVRKRFPLYAEITVAVQAKDPFTGDGEPFRCQATVVRCCKVGTDREYQLGLFFTHLTEENLAQIMDMAYY
ncbi:MAG: PilZ domain-containing protein [Candidatus Auribacterota bacterium]